MRPVGVLTLALTLLQSGCAAPSPAERQACLVAVGGGGTPESVTTRAIELAGGPRARGVVLAQASERPEAGEESASFWRERGLEHVVPVDLTDAAAARAAIESADLIWFPGGDQSRLLEALEKSGLIEVIRARHRAGAVVGGTSAGAAVLSPLMIIGGETADLTVVRKGSVATTDGLALLPGTIIDQHFLKRQRFNRLLSTVLEHPELVGIGIDEKTAIVVRGTRLEVLGESGVLVLDARDSSSRGSEAVGRTAAGSTRLVLLREGMTFDLAARPDG